MTRGSVYWINLEPSHPPEFGKTRPGLIVSNTEQNAVLDSVVVVPLSSHPPEIWPLRVACRLPREKKPSFVVLPGIRQINKGRLLQRIGLLDPRVMERIDEALALYLGIEIR